MSVLEHRVTSNARLGFSISKPSYFCMWNFVSADKAPYGLSAETKLHIQKCDTCRYMDNPNGIIRSFTMVQYMYTQYLVILVYKDSCTTKFSTAVYTCTCRSTAIVYSIVLVVAVHVVLNLVGWD